MNYYTFVLVVVIFAAVFLLCRTTSHDNYEITDLAFNICQKKCLERGYSYGLCSDKNKLENCISKMIKISDAPPPGTTFVVPK